MCCLENESFLETLVMVSPPITVFISHLVKYQRTTRPDERRNSRMIKLSSNPLPTTYSKLVSDYDDIAVLSIGRYYGAV